MLKVTLRTAELFDEANFTVIAPMEVTVKLEHSLISLSKWESKWKLPLLATPNLEGKMLNDYIRCMVIGPGVDSLTDEFLDYLDPDSLRTVIEYINDPMTATTIQTYEDKKGKKPDREVKTAELLYHYMIALEIPFSCEQWHINRLLTLIQVRSAKLNEGNDKMSDKEILQRNRALNAKRKAAIKK